MMFKHITLLTILSIFLFGCSNTNERPGYESEEASDENSVLYILDEDLDTVVAVACEESYPSYESTNNGEFNNGEICLTYPSSWEVVQQNAEATDRTTIAVQVMQKSLNDYEFRPNINVICSNDKYKESPYALAKASFNQIKDAGLSTSLIGINNCTVGGYKGSVAEYTVDIENHQLHIYQYIIKKNDNTTLTITTSLDNKNLNTQRKTAQDIINSITIF